MATSADYYAEAKVYRKQAFIQYGISAIFWAILLAGFFINLVLDIDAPPGLRPLVGFAFGFAFTYLAMQFMKQGRRYHSREKDTLSWAKRYEGFEKAKLTPPEGPPVTFGKITINEHD